MVENDKTVAMQITGGSNSSGGPVNPGSPSSGAMWLKSDDAEATDVEMDLTVDDEADGEVQLPNDEPARDWEIKTITKAGASATGAIRLGEQKKLLQGKTVITYHFGNATPPPIGGPADVYDIELRDVHKDYTVKLKVTVKR